MGELDEPWKNQKGGGTEDIYSGRMLSGAGMGGILKDLGCKMTSGLEGGDKRSHRLREDGEGNLPELV